MRIAYEHADSFVTYPQAPKLSAKAQPIRERQAQSAAATHTRSCAAGPDRWQCGRPAWTTTCGVNLRMKGPRYSPVRPILPPRVDRTRAHHTYPSPLLELTTDPHVMSDNTERLFPQVA